MMASEAMSARERYYHRFISELDGRVETILGAATLLRESGIPTLPGKETPETAPLHAAVDDIYRHAHSIRGIAGTLGIEPAQEAADLLAETALHLNEEGMLADETVWELIVRAADGLAVFGAACRQGHPPESTALAAQAPILRAAFNRRFAPPESAVDDFLEVARVLRLTDEEIAAFRFPTEEHRNGDTASSTAFIEAAAAAVTTAPAHEAVDSPAPIAPAVETPVTTTPAPLIHYDQEAIAPSGTPNLAAEATPVADLTADLPEALPAALVAHVTGEQILAERDSHDVQIDVTGGTGTHPAAAGVVPAMRPQSQARESENPTQETRVSRALTILCQSSTRLLEQSAPALARLEEDRWDLSAMRTVRRVFHTLKGDGRQVGLGGLAALAEAAEDVFDAVFAAREAAEGANHGVPAEALPLLWRAHHTLADLLADPERAAAGGEADQEQVEALLAVARLAGGPSGAAESRHQRLLPVFLAEARRLCDTLHGQIAILHRDPAEIQALLGSIRVLHTLKGNAASMEQAALVALAGGGESLLEQAATNGEPLSPVQIGLLGDLDGALRHVIDTVDHGEAYDQTALTLLLAALAAGDVHEPRPEAPRPAPQERAQAPAAQDASSPVPVNLAQVRLVPRSAPSTPTGASDPAAAAAGTTPKPIFMPRSSSEPERARAQRRALTESITAVDLAAVDRGIDLFGRLVTSRTMIARGIQDLERPASESARNNQRLRAIIDKLAGEFDLVRRERRAASARDGWDAVELETFDSFTQIMLELGEIIADQEEIADTLREGVRRSELTCENDQEATDALQQALLGFRLVRLSTIAPRLEQVVTSTARAVGKQATWKLRGEDIAVDKAVLDAVQEPLLHLLRNAIDHGIEPAAERTAKGKPAEGTITVEASYGANIVVITIADDGGGIDPKRVAATAVARGVLSAEAAAALDERGMLDLIWQPGFSTAGTVTEISGRGVGLDIVRHAIVRVRGSVSVESAVGRGTRFSLSLPRSLSVVRTLLVRDGAATVAAPITQIEGVHLVRSADIAALPDRTVALVEGRTVTLLEQGLGQPNTLAARLTGDRVTVLEVRAGGDSTVGFVIDDVLGEEDTLVKALPGYLAHRGAFVGCSVAGDGRPYAIVDLRQLAALSGGGRGAGGVAPLLTLPGPARQAVQPLVLVVDDSLFMRRSLAELYAGAGFRVETAEDGEAALAAIARLGMPTLISLDMEMPRMNGLEMLAVLRQLPGGTAVPVFMITTRGQERHRRAAMNAGVTRYFIKPYATDDLLAAARDVCRDPLVSGIA